MAKKKVYTTGKTPEQMKELNDYLESDQCKKDTEEFEEKLKKENEEKRKKKIKLDKEKASYLFDKEEIEEIEKDLNENEVCPSPIYVYADSLFTQKDKDLFEAMASVSPEESLLSAELTIRKEKGIRLKELDKQKDGVRRRAIREASSIEKELANQKGLAKLWTINEKFGMDPEANINEEDAFNRAVKSPTEPENSDFRQFRHKPRDIDNITFRSKCPKCEGKRTITILGLKMKCFKCRGLGSILVDAKTYYQTEGNTRKPLTFREQFKKEQHEQKGYGTIIRSDGLGENIYQRVHPTFYED